MLDIQVLKWVMCPFVGCAPITHERAVSVHRATCAGPRSVRIYPPIWLRAQRGNKADRGTLIWVFCARTLTRAEARSFRRDSAGLAAGHVQIGWQSRGFPFA
jgi:hypothetical protein